MNTTSHRLVGACAVLGLTHQWPQPAWTVAIGTAAAALFAGGATSPDIDQRWKTADTLLPDEALGHGGPLKHRGLTHFWGLPAVFAVLTYVPVMASPWWAQAAVVGAWIGWVSHLFADALIGASNARYGLSAGVPIMPWWGYLGTGWANTGWVASLIGVLLPVAFVWLAGTLALGLPVQAPLTTLSAWLYPNISAGQP